MRANYDFSKGVRGKYVGKLPRSIFKGGEENPAAKATWDVVAYIRKRYEPFVVTAPMLAAETGLSAPTVRKIIKGERWRNGYVRTTRQRKLTAEDLVRMLELHELGYGYKRLGKIFGVDGNGTVRKHIKNQLRKKEGAAL